MAGYTEEEYEQSQSPSMMAAPAKGTQEWAVQNSGKNAPEFHPEQNAVPGTKEYHEKTQPSVHKAPGTSTQSSEAQTESTSVPGYGNMQDVIDFLEDRRAAIHIPTQAELEKERRRKRAEGIVSSIADGTRALSNLIFTTQYAPDMYRQEDSLSGRMKDRYDRLKAEREADADRYFNYSLTIGKLKDAQDDRTYQRGRDALQDEIRMSQETRAQLKADRDAAMAELRMQLMEGKISAQEAAARAKDIEAQYAENYWKAKIDVLESQKKKNDRWVPGHSGGGGRSGGKPAEHAWRDKDGNLHYAHSESAARSQAAAHGGTYVTTPVRRTSTKPNKWGQTSTTTTETDVSTPKRYAKTSQIKW